jgi:hypothetical protein
MKGSFWQLSKEIRVERGGILSYDAVPIGKVLDPAHWPAELYPDFATQNDTIVIFSRLWNPTSLRNGRCSTPVMHGRRRHGHTRFPGPFDSLCHE